MNVLHTHDDVTRGAATDAMWYASDTQVLTPRGWSFLGDLADGQHVAQVDDRGAIDFVLPVGRQEKRHVGELLHLRADAIDLAVVPRQGVGSHRDAFATVAEDGAQPSQGSAVPLGCRVRQGGVRRGGRSLSRAERRDLERAILVHADAYVRPDAPLIEVFATSPVGRARMRRLFQSVEEEVGGTAAAISFRDRCLRWLQLPSKDFRLAPLLELSADDLGWFVDEVMKGNKESRRTHCYVQHPARAGSAEAVQAAAVLSGHRAVWTIRESGYEAVTLGRSPVTRTPQVAVTNEPYEGVVYSVSVPSRMILMRRHANVVCGVC